VEALTPVPAGIRTLAPGTGGSYDALAVLLIAVESPVDYWAGDYFFAHMIQHLLLMFAAPSLIVAGAPWSPLLAALSGRSGRSVTRGVLAGGWSRPVRAFGGLLLRRGCRWRCSTRR
jgi:hypothetical protein